MEIYLCHHALIKLLYVETILLITFHTPPECMAKWLTSQNRNLVSVSILYMRSSAAVHVMAHLNAWGQCVIDERKEHKRTTSPRIWLDFFSSEFRYSVLYCRYKGVKSKVYSVNILFIENEHDTLWWWCRDTEYYICIYIIH